MPWQTRLPRQNRLQIKNRMVDKKMNITGKIKLISASTPNRLALSGNDFHYWGLILPSIKNVFGLSSKKRCGQIGLTD